MPVAEKKVGGGQSQKFPKKKGQSKNVKKEIYLCPKCHKTFDELYIRHHKNRCKKGYWLENTIFFPTKLNIVKI